MVTISVRRYILMFNWRYFHLWSDIFYHNRCKGILYKGGCHLGDLTAVQMYCGLFSLHMHSNNYLRASSYYLMRRPVCHSRRDNYRQHCAQCQAPVFKLPRGRFEVPRSARATRCTDDGEIWQGPLLHVCLSVCLSVTLLNVRVCAPDFAMKALEYRNDFDAVG